MKRRQSGSKSASSGGSTRSSREGSEGGGGGGDDSDDDEAGPGRRQPSTDTRPLYDGGGSPGGDFSFGGAGEEAADQHLDALQAKEVTLHFSEEGQSRPSVSRKPASRKPAYMCGCVIS